MVDTINNSAGLSQTYIEKLTGEYKMAEFCFNEYHKAALKAEEEYILAKDWEKCVKDYYSKLSVTYTMVANLDILVENFSAYTKKICQVVGFAKQGTKVLMSNVRCLSEQNEQLKQAIKNLLEIIDCLNQPVLDPNVSIMKCIKDLKDKVDAGIVANLTAVKELLKLMQLMFELQAGICSNVTEDQGLRFDLIRLKSILKCAYPYDSSNPELVCGSTDSTYDTPSFGDLKAAFITLNCNDDCGSVITISQVPDKPDCSQDRLHPRLCDEYGRDYLEKLKTKWDNAKRLSCYLKYVWDYFKDLEQKSKSNRDATKAALDAAVAAKAKCK